MRHELKIESPFFKAVKEGRKTFEIRNNDRGFNAGDTVLLKEITYLGWLESYTGEESLFKIGYVTNFEQKEGYVVFSLLPTEPEDKK